jgi:hypothetical protein
MHCEVLRALAVSVRQAPEPELKAEVADVLLHPAERGITGREFHDNGGTALQAIKLKCLDCSGYNRAEVKGCTFTSCALHPLRLGKAKPGLNWRNKPAP